MTKPTGPKWPKTTDGTTDWEAVFEDETGGLISVIAKASSIDGLNECATVVVKSLFTRTGDQPEVARFMSLLITAIIEGRGHGDVELTKSKVIGILREIKRERLQKAETFVEEKRRGQAIERRASGGADFFVALFGPRWAKLGMGLSVALLVGVLGMGGFYYLSKTGELVAAAEAQRERQMTDGAGVKADRAPGAGQSVQDEIKKKPPADAVKPEPKQKAPVESEPRHEYPKAVLLKPFYWSYTSKKGRKRYITYQPLVVVPNEGQYRTVCVNAPWVTDAIYLSTSRVHPPDRRANAAEISKIGKFSLRKINNRYGAGTVGEVSLVLSTDARFRDGVKRCELEFKTSEMKRY